MIFGKSLDESARKTREIDAWWRGRAESGEVTRRFALLPTGLENGRIIWLSFYDEVVVRRHSVDRTACLSTWPYCEISEWNHPEFRISRRAAGGGTTGADREHLTEGYQVKGGKNGPVSQIQKRPAPPVPISQTQPH